MLLNRVAISSLSIVSASKGKDKELLRHEFSKGRMEQIMSATQSKCATLSPQSSTSNAKQSAESQNEVDVQRFHPARMNSAVQQLYLCFSHASQDSQDGKLYALLGKLSKI